MSSLRKALIEQMKVVIICIAGNAVTTGNADKDVKGLIYAEAHKYINNGRLLIDFRDQLEKRNELFEDWCGKLLKMDEEEVMKGLQDEFPVNPSRAVIESYFKLFKEAQSDSKNEFGCIYKKLNVEKSGVYDDEAVIKHIIENSIHKRIDGNFYKAVNEVLGKFKKVAEGERAKTEEEVRVEQKRLENDKRAMYESKKANWKSESLPKGFLAFTLLGMPGRALTAMMADPPATGKSKLSRRALGGCIDSSSSSDTKSNENDDRKENVVRKLAEANSLKNREVAVKERMLNAQERNEKLDLFKLKISTLIECGMTEEANKAKQEMLAMINENLQNSTSQTTQTLQSSTSQTTVRFRTPNSNLNDGYQVFGHMSDQLSTGSHCTSLLSNSTNEHNSSVHASLPTLRHYEPARNNTNAMRHTVGIADQFTQDLPDYNDDYDDNDDFDFQRTSSSSSSSSSSSMVETTQSLSGPSSKRVRNLFYNGGARDGSLRAGYNRDNN